MNKKIHLLVLSLMLVSLNACSKEDQGDIPKGWKVPSSEEYQKCTGEDKSTVVEFNSELETRCGSAFRPKPTQSELDWLKARTRERMVFVEGGTFWMGDFTSLQNEHSVLPLKKNLGYVYASTPPYSDQYKEGEKIVKQALIYPTIPYAYSAPRSQVRLDGYSMGAYMVEEQEYNLFAGAKGYPMANSYLRRHMREFDAAKEVPANVVWDQAQEYCQWLGDQVGVPMSLPTESQWEYAARNRGEFRVFATDNGLFEDGRNALLIPQSSLLYPTYTFEYKKALLAKFKSMPPNPLGIYNMQNLPEQVYDWYDPSYFPANVPKDIVLENPRGPANQVVTSGPEYDSEAGKIVEVETKHGKVIRGLGHLSGSGDSLFTFYSEERDKVGALWAFRCVANRSTPLK